MKFKHSVIGDNTAENREWLEKIGYKRNDSNDGDTLCVGFDGLYQVKEYKLGRTMFNVFLDMMKPVDCIGNDNLFRAVSAMRDDDKIESKQYYVLSQDKGYIKDGVFVIDYPKGSIIKNPLSLFISFEGRKATLEELQEHFKK